MNAERLLQHYERIADAPDAIARLRRFILDLAVRGKLMPQDPGDEPASELFKRIAQEKTRLVNAGEIRKPPTFEPITVAEALYALPKTWAWVRVGEIFDYDAGTKRDPKDLDQSRWLLELEDIEKDTSRILERLRVSDRDSLSTKSEFAPGDILYGKLRPYLNKVVVADEHGYSTTEIVAIRAFLRQCSEYCALAFRRPDFVAYVERLGRGTKMPRLRTPDAIVAPFPLPPLAEQHRIVAKVDELMVLCDQFEAARTAREQMRDRMAAASLARLNAPDPETFQADIRFALGALPALTARQDQIKQLRQTILNLAVRGKLVPQDDSSQTREVELESLVKIVRGSSPRPKGDPRYYGGPVPRLLIADITRDGKHVIPQLDTLTTEGAKLSRPMPKGSLVLAISGSYGVPAFLAVDACIHDGFIGFRDVSREVDPEYLFLVMLFRRPYFDDVVKDSGLKNLTTEHLKRLVVPLTPLAEQRRIVAKVDALMALCDQLEVSLTDTFATRRRLLDALLAEALAPAATDALPETEDAV